MILTNKEDQMNFIQNKIFRLQTAMQDCLLIDKARAIKLYLAAEVLEYALAQM